MKWLKLALATALTGAIKGGVALAQHSIAWWLAAVIAFAVVYLGVLVIDEVDW